MKTHHPFVRALLLSVLMGMLVASAALAKTGGLGFFRLSAAGDVTSCPSPTPSPSPSESPSPSPSPSESPSPDESPSSDQGDQDEQGENDQGTSDQQESDDCKDEGTDQGPTPKPSPSADREKACMDAAGMSTDSTAAGTAGTPQVKTTGLDHAIEMVLANCIKNPQAPGLLNALHHLVANRDRHAALDAEKAARKAAHDAAKAARKAAGHGH
jgi:hypothetical protein